MPAGFVLRAKIVLLLADGVSARAVEAVETKLDASRPTIAKWRRRFLECSVEGLTNRHRGRPRWKLTVRLRARVLAATRRPPPDGTTHWSCCRLAAHLGVNKNIVQRVWREADVRPHQLARYMASNDPDFETKAADAADIIGLFTVTIGSVYLSVGRGVPVAALALLDRQECRTVPSGPGRWQRR